MSKEKVTKLTTYLNKMLDLAKTAPHPEKKAFFEREIRKTQAHIGSLSK